MPSNSLAVRTGCSIFAEEDLLDEAGFVDEVEEELSPDDVVEEFRHFIDNVSPDDFAS